MRRARFLVAASVALAVSGCARDAQYVEQVSPPANVPHRSAASMYSSSPAYAQQAQEQTGSLPSDPQPRADNKRGLFTSQAAAPVSTAQSTPKPALAPPPQQTTTDNNRGLFGSRSATPLYAAQPASPPPASPPQQTATDNNRGAFTSRWAATFDSPQPDQRAVPVTRVTSAPRPAHDAEVYERTGSLPSQASSTANKKRGWFPSSADESFDSARPTPPSVSAANKTQPAPRPIPAARMYTSSAASAQQAYEQPPPPSQEAPMASNARGLFTTRSSAPGYAAQPPATGGPYVTPSYGYASASAVASAPAASETVYTLGVGDKLRIVVFGQDGISNTYIVDAAGKVNMPLIGAVPARGLTNQQLSDAVAARLKQGYVREPHVTVEVETYRPFFILGEVTTPGQYPYVVNMTAETAVAIAGGFAPRAFKKTVELTRKTGGQQTRSEVPLDYAVRPGDTIVVKERWF